MANVVINDDSLKAIGAAIRNKNGTQNSYTPGEMASAINAIPTGGGSGEECFREVIRKDVNFCDYDGKCIYAYTLEEANALTELPNKFPTYPGFICQGWNWTLEEVQNLDRQADIGLHYITDDGTTRLYLENINRLKIRLAIGINGSAHIDWGDGTQEDKTAQDASTALFIPHTYPTPGNYVISLKENDDSTVINLGPRNELFVPLQDGVIISPQESTNFYEINKQVNGRLKKIALNERVTIHNSSFRLDANAKIFIPKNVKDIFFNSASTEENAYIVCPHNETPVEGGTVNLIVNPLTKFTQNNRALFPNSEVVYFPDGTNFSRYTYFSPYKCLKLYFPNIQELDFLVRDNAVRYDFTRCAQVPILKRSLYAVITNDAKIIVPDALYDSWIVADLWKDVKECIIKQSEEVK